MQIAKRTDVGKWRESNQDQADVFTNRSDQVLALLCDGMGGHNAGDVASEMALYQVGVAWQKTDKMTTESVRKWFESTIEAANHRVYDVSTQYQDLAGMGTTIVALALLGDCGIIAHVGDSRLYRLRDGQFEQLMKDHTYVQALVDQGVMTPEEANHSLQKHQITQAIGVDDKVSVALSETELQPQDKYLLCSDGLTDMLADARIQAILEQESTVDSLATELIQQANDAGGQDNITVVVVAMEGSDSE
ncbi:MAG: Stp1/IreP family PP2C-type Ser/Thr phosphatase [Aerococcus sp.]|nr:Stp1/IreP family PP2C-type Ser/Thr phosphatase [Aerococcus sp.]